MKNGTGGVRDLDFALWAARAHRDQRARRAQRPRRALAALYRCLDAAAPAATNTREGDGAHDERTVAAE